MNDLKAQQGAHLLADAMRASGARTMEDLVQQMRNAGSGGDLREWIAQHQNVEPLDSTNEEVRG